MEKVLGFIQSDVWLNELRQIESPVSPEEEALHHGHSSGSPLAAGEDAPFRWDHVRVKLKKEIMSLGMPTVSPIERVGEYVSSQQWNPLISDPDNILSEIAVMRAGRKNLRWAVNEREVTLSEGQNIVRTISVRGSNIIEVMDAQGNKLLVLLQAKFQKTLWVGRGGFVVVDDSGKEKALESQGARWGALFLEFSSMNKCESFRSLPIDSQKMMSFEKAEEMESESVTSEDEGLPPLEPNTNRRRPQQLERDESDSTSSSDSDS